MTEQRNPSEVLDVFWLYAQGRSQPTKRPGKWLIFVSAEKVDSAWGLIKKATESGKLGPASKVSTAWTNRNSRDRNMRVICIYTCDWADESDVFRVREALRELGFTQELFYKSDEDTRGGKYSNRGSRSISKYRG